MAANGTAPTLCASGVHRVNEDTGTTTCVGHRGACATNDAIGWATASGKIYASEVDSLRVAIRREVDAYVAHSSFAAITKKAAAAITNNPPQLIDHQTPNDLGFMVNEMYGSGTLSKATGNQIDDADWQSLINKYNVLRQNCICNSDCACNAVCACYGDCACNYSDERLKENIQFIKTENGLNIYSWNYIWDKTQRFVGVMAQELLNTIYSDAVVAGKNGYYMVNYCKLPVTKMYKLGEI